MDIQHLVDRLEDLIDEGRHLFGTKFTMVDEERALEIIDQMRISVPEENRKGGSHDSAAGPRPGRGERGSRAHRAAGSAT